MATEPIKLPKGWIAFVKDSKVLGIQNLPHGGKYYGKSVIVSGETKEALLFTLSQLNYTLP